ncbi:MAG: autotransporter domain-containing protein [Planctomycetaceae bacterium]|nr:autotransporter domain-containing protein [Planctomycetaceae bacterium]
MRGKLVLTLLREKVRLFVAIVLAISPCTAPSTYAQDTYTAQQDGQWLQFHADGLDALSPDLLLLMQDEFPEYLTDTGDGTWGETALEPPESGFHFPGGGPNNNDTVHIGSYHILLGVNLSLKEALEEGEYSLELPMVFQIGELSVEGGSLTILDDSQLALSAISMNGGTLINKGTIWLYGDENTTLLQSTGSFENSGTLIVSNGTADFGTAVGYSGGGAIILDGNTVLKGKMQIDHGGEITVYGANNLINAQNMVISPDTEGTGQLILASENRGGEVQLTGELQFDPAVATKELVLRDLFANVDTESYTNVDRTLVQSGTVLRGSGYANTSFLFDSMSYHDARGTQTTQTFHADEIHYGDGSTIYVNIGSAGYDKIMANAISFAKNDNEQVNVVLFNLGSHSEHVIAHDLFSVTGDIPDEGGDPPMEPEQVTGIQLGGGEIASATKSLDADSNTAKLMAENGSKIVFQSGSYTGNDMLTINNILIGESSQTLGVDVTGVVYDPNAKPWDGLPVSANTNVIVNTIIDNMYGTPLYSAIAAKVGNNLETLLDIAAALDPAITSVETATVQSHTMQFNRLIGNRLQASQASVMTGPGGLASYTNASHVYRAQNRVAGDYQRMNSAFNSGLWFEGLGAYTNQDDKDALTGFSGETFGFGVGYDRRLNRNFLLGMAFGGTYGNMRARQNAGTSKSDNYIGSLYGNYHNGPWSFSLSGGYASASIKSHREVPTIGVADGKRNGNTWFASTEISYRLDGRKCYLAPFYRFDFVGYHEDAFTETGQNINMSFSARNDKGFLQTTGVRVGTQFTNAADWKIVPELTAGWIHDYGDGEITTTAQFVQGGPAIVLDGLSRVKERALVGLGLNVTITPQCNAFARYDGELASKFCTHTGQIGMYLYF